MKIFAGHVWVNRDSTDIAKLVALESHNRVIEALVTTRLSKLEMKTAIIKNTHLVAGDDLRMVTQGKFSSPVRDFFSTFGWVKDEDGALVLWKRAVKGSPIVLIRSIHAAEIKTELIAHWQYRSVRGADDEKLGLYIEPV